MSPARHLSRFRGTAPLNMDILTVDFFAVPSATFRILFALVVLRHDRLHVIHFNITAHPTAEWAAQQIVEAFPFDDAPRFLIRDRDGIYGDVFQKRTQNMDIEEVLIAPRSPWQNPYCERLVGSIRWECLDRGFLLRGARKIAAMRPEVSTIRRN